MLVHDAKVKTQRMLVTKIAKTVTNIFKLSSTNFVCYQRHQHRCHQAKHILFLHKGSPLYNIKFRRRISQSYIFSRTCISKNSLSWYQHALSQILWYLHLNDKHQFDFSQQKFYYTTGYKTGIVTRRQTDLLTQIHFGFQK